MLLTAEVATVWKNKKASAGASGSLFGLIGLMLVDLLQTWKRRFSPKKDLCIILLDIILSFVMGNDPLFFVRKAGNTRS